MKRVLLLIAMIFVSSGILISQVPQAFKYQAIARDESGNILSNWDIGLQISIVETITQGQKVYVEVHHVKSNLNGMIDLVIGEGRREKGEFEEIKWGENSYFIKMEMDIDGGSDYKEIGTTQLYAVPYALYAEQAGAISPDSNPHEKHNANSNSGNSNSSRNGSPNTKFPGDGDSWANANVGKLGVGTTDPQEKLDVNGNAKAKMMIMVDANGKQWVVVPDTTGLVKIIFRFLVCGDSLYDPRDGKYYQTVQIGTQCWFAENLNVGTGINGTSNQLDNGVIEKFCYENSDANCEEYGGLYQWGEAVQYDTIEGTQGICPIGWHIPDTTEWKTVIAFLGGLFHAGGKMKEIGTTHWKDPNEGATNESGFTALGAGHRSTSGGFGALLEVALFWSSSKITLLRSGRTFLHYSTKHAILGDTWDTNGFSVRCIKN